MPHVERQARGETWDDIDQHCAGEQGCLGQSERGYRSHMACADNRYFRAGIRHRRRSALRRIVNPEQCRDRSATPIQRA
jgi:hypothetical protein